jgi:hypothetical protein
MISLILVLLLACAAAVIDTAVQNTSGSITIGIPSEEVAQSILEQLNNSGHIASAPEDARWLHVIVNCSGGMRPNLALWGLWKEVNDLALQHGVGAFYFGDQWLRPNPEAKAKVLDWSTPPHLTLKQWWRQIAEKAGILRVFPRFLSN